MGFFCTSTFRFIVHADSGYVCHWWGLFLRMRLIFMRSLFEKEPDTNWVYVEKEPYTNWVLLHKHFPFCCARGFRIRLSLMRSLFEDASRIHEVTFWRRALCKWGSFAQAPAVLLCTHVQDTSVIDEVSFGRCASYSLGLFFEKKPDANWVHFEKEPM